jgi:hypothetical protein
MCLPSRVGASDSEHAVEGKRPLTGPYKTGHLLCVLTGSMSIERELVDQKSALRMVFRERNPEQRADRQKAMLMKINTVNSQL